MGDLPRGTVAAQARDERGVHGVARALGHYPAEDAVLRESEISDQIQNFVTNKFIGKAQGSILNALLANDDGAVVGNAADQAHVAQLLFIRFEAEGSSRGDFRSISACAEIDGKTVSSDGCRKVDGVVDGVGIGGVDSDELVAIVNLDVLEYAQIFAATTLTGESARREGLDVGQGAAVEDWQLKIVEFDDDIVYAHTGERGEQMLSCG